VTRSSDPQQDITGGSLTFTSAAFTGSSSTRGLDSGSGLRSTEERGHFQKMQQNFVKSRGSSCQMEGRRGAGRGWPAWAWRRESNGARWETGGEAGFASSEKIIRGAARRMGEYRIA